MFPIFQFINLILCMVFSFGIAPSFAFSKDVTTNFPFKVLVVKGNKAIIVIPRSINLEAGSIYRAKEANSDTAVEVENSAEGVKFHSIMFDMAISMLSSKEKSSSTSEKTDLIDFSISYGWNFINYEIGPYLEYSFVKQEMVDTKKIVVGGFFDFNLEPNTESVASLFAVRAKLGLGQLDSSVWSNASDYTSMKLGLAYKNFGLDTNVCMDIFVGYLMESIKQKSTNIVNSGLISSIGITSYF